MMQKIFLFALAAAIFAGCAKNELTEAGQTAESGNGFTVTAVMPEGQPEARVSLEKATGSKNILVKWKTGDKIKLFFRQGTNNPVEGEEVTVNNISADGKKAYFNVNLPTGISAGSEYTVYLVHGATANINNDKIDVDVSPVGFKSLNELSVPIAGKASVAPGASVGSVTLNHLGALQCLTVKSIANGAHTESFSLSYTGGQTGFYGGGTTYDLISESVSATGTNPPDWQSVTVAAGAETELAQWIMPNGNTPGKIKLVSGNISSLNSRTRSAALVKSRAYHLYVLWDGTDLKFTNDQFTPPVIWAGSNIYWDGSKLTFDEEPENNSDLFQGVFFRWGSLIGISPSSDYVTYTPAYNSGAPASSTWSEGNRTFASITHLMGAPIPNGGPDNTYLNDVDRNTDAMYQSFNGDICQYLAKTGAVEGDWRMPVSSEFNPANVAMDVQVNWGASSAPWTRFGPPAYTLSGNAKNGTTQVTWGAFYQFAASTSRFAASGYRQRDGVLNNLGIGGYYWSSSASAEAPAPPITDINVLYFYFGGQRVTPYASFNHSNGYPIRCVRK